MTDIFREESMKNKIVAKELNICTAVKGRDD